MKLRIKIPSTSKVGAWAIAEYAWYPFITLISTPFLLSGIGAEHYGYWMLLNTFTGLAGLFIGGNSAAEQRAITHPEGESISSIISASVAIALITSAALAVIIEVTLIFQKQNLFPYIFDVNKFMLVIVVAPAFIALEIVDNVFSSGLKAFEQYKINARIEICVRTVQVAATVLSAIVSNSIISIFCILFAANVVRTFWKARTLREYASFNLEYPRFRSINRLISTAKWGWIQGGTGLLYTVLDKFVVTALFGPAILSIYSICIQLASQIHAVTAAGFNVVLPRVARLSAQSNGQDTRGTINKSLVWNLAFSTVIALIIYMAGGVYIQQLQLNGSQESIQFTFGLTCVSFYLLSLNVSSYYTLAGLGMLKKAAINSVLASGGLAIALAIASPISAPTQVIYGRIAYALIALLLIWEARNAPIRN